MKVVTRNNLLRKITNSEMVENEMTTALALCYYVAEYTAPIWEDIHMPNNWTQILMQHVAQ